MRASAAEEKGNYACAVEIKDRVSCSYVGRKQLFMSLPAVEGAGSPLTGPAQAPLFAPCEEHVLGRGRGNRERSNVEGSFVFTFLQTNMLCLP